MENSQKKLYRFVCTSKDYQTEVIYWGISAEDARHKFRVWNDIPEDEYIEVVDYHEILCQK